MACWHDFALPDGWLVAGAVVQTVWNDAFNLPPDHGIDDIDLIYFDPGDLSAEAENTQAERIRACLDKVPIRLDVKNQARVHLWYQAKFGQAIAPYRSSAEAIATFPTTAAAIGIRPTGGNLEFTAPFGFDDLLGLIVRPNKRQVTADVYERKIRRWRKLWPDLRIVGWTD